jgi:hypothetical protein
MRKKVVFIIFVILGLLFLPQIIGPVIDLVTYPQLKKEAENALQYFAEADVDDTNNAWYYYSRAGEQFDDGAWHKEVYSYIDEKIEITKNVRTAVRENKEALDLMRYGTERSFCRIPFDPEIWTPSSFHMSSSIFKIVDLIVARAFFNLEEMNNEDAIADIFSMMTISEHVASNGHAIDYMMGGKFQYQSCKLLEIGLESGVFDEAQLEIISDKLMAFEKEWPKFARVLEIEAITMLLMLSESSKERSGSVFMAKVLLRYIHWKYLFSYNFAYLGGYRFMIKLSDELRGKEDIDSLISCVDDNLKENVEERIRDYCWKNFMYGMMLANLDHLFERRLDILSKIRVLHLCSEVQRYKWRNGHFPADIDNFERRVSIDFNTGKCFNYANFGDSVVVSSRGPDLNDEKDDVSLTLTDIGIKQYLERKRDACKKLEE